MSTASISSLLRCTSLALIVGAAPLAPAQAGADQPPIVASQGLPDLLDRLLPGVVTITATHHPEPAAQSEIPPEILQRFIDPRLLGSGPGTPPHQSLGSGFVIGAEGYIVTNNHVIADADEISVTLAEAGDLPARLVGTDPLSDLALLKIETKKPLAVLAWGDSDKARIGETVVAIGNPFGLGGTVTAGILSARARDIGAGPYDDFLQTDAPINRGNSGGPLINLAGEVIGINTAIFSPPGQGGGSVGIAFAIPSAAARSVIEQLKESGKVRRGLLGVGIQEVTEDLAEGLGLDHPAGALVTSVAGPAARAGIQPGDVILFYDGKKVADFHHLPRMVAATKVATEVAVNLWRRNQPVTVAVTVDELAPEQQASTAAPAHPSDDDKLRLAELGIELAAITPDLRDQFGLEDDEVGIVVTEVADDSDAADQGVRPGDIVRAVAMEEVTSLAQVTEKIAAARASGEQTVLLLVDDDGEMSFVDLPLAPVH